MLRDELARIRATATNIAEAVVSKKTVAMFEYIKTLETRVAKIERELKKEKGKTDGKL